MRGGWECAVKDFGVELWALLRLCASSYLKCTSVTLICMLFTTFVVRRSKKEGPADELLVLVVGAAVAEAADGLDFSKAFNACNSAHASCLVLACSCCFSTYCKDRHLSNIVGGIQARAIAGWRTSSRSAESLGTARRLTPSICITSTSQHKRKETNQRHTYRHPYRFTARTHNPRISKQYNNHILHSHLPSRDQGTSI